MESENTLVIAAKAPVKVMLEAGKDYVCYGCGKSKSQPFCKHSQRAACIAPLKFSSEVRVRSGGILTDFTHDVVMMISGSCLLKQLLVGGEKCPI